MRDLHKSGADSASQLCACSLPTLLARSESLKRIPQEGAAAEAAAVGSAYAPQGAVELAVAGDVVAGGVAPVVRGQSMTIVELPPLPEPWTEHVDEESGACAGAPTQDKGAKRHVRSLAGYTYYYDSTTGASTWDRPGETPAPEPAPVNTAGPAQGRPEETPAQVNAAEPTQNPEPALVNAPEPTLDRPEETPAQVNTPGPAQV